MRLPAWYRFADCHPALTPGPRVPTRRPCNGPYLLSYLYRLPLACVGAGASRVAMWGLGVDDVDIILYLSLLDARVTLDGRALCS